MHVYPRLSIDAPPDLVVAAEALAMSINRDCEFVPPAGRTLTLSWRGGEPAAERVTLAAHAWNLWIDASEPTRAAAEPPAAMAAAARSVSVHYSAQCSLEHLTHGRTGPEPLALNLVTLDEPSETPPTPERVALGTLHLAGCGAIGEAAAGTFVHLPVTGTLYAVDHDTLDDGNLHRYVLGLAEDVGKSKPTLIARAFEGHPLEVVQVPTHWGKDSRTAPGRDTVLSALDTKQGRIELQAGLPRELFNAWTQPQDIGVSRHQRFGETMPGVSCLAAALATERDRADRDRSRGAGASGRSVRHTGSSRRRPAPSRCLAGEPPSATSLRCWSLGGALAIG